MTPKQLFERLRDSLKSLTWTGTSNKIFGEAVYVAPKIPIQQLASFPRPCCFLLDEGAVNYEMHDDLAEQKFKIVVFVENAGERHGESVVLGGNRTANTSRGAGLLDIESEVINDLRTKTELSSSKITLKNKSRIRSEFVKGAYPSVFRTLNFSCITSTKDNSDHEAILRSPGFLYWGATDFGNENFGTKLGFLNEGVIFDPGFIVDELTSMDEGATPNIDLFSGMNAFIEANFLSYNATVLARLFPGMTSGTSVNIPSSRKTGSLLSSDNSGVLTFVPDDLTNNKIVVFYKAVPFMSRNTRIARGGDIFWTCIFRARENGSGKIVFIGDKDDA